LICNGYSAIGNPMVAIFGNKSEAVISSGTEWPMSMPSRNASKSLVSLEIVLMLRDVLQPKMQSRLLWIAIGLEAT
jgi:hypothetical protein